jgi:hypothetical protein
MDKKIPLRQFLLIFVVASAGAQAIPAIPDEAGPCWRNLLRGR